MLSSKQNTELNSIVTYNNGHSEPIQLDTLDRCMERYDWHDIDFIKIDAEGQESKIISGARKFLLTNSPLIMYEIKHGDSFNISLIKQFKALDCFSYKLIPELNILIPFNIDDDLDSFQLNLFFAVSRTVLINSENKVY